MVSEKDRTGPPHRRVKTPTVLQIEAVECGAASLAMVLAHHGRIVPLEQLRVECGVSRDGSKASKINQVARSHGLDARGFRKQIHELWDMPLPMIIFWKFNHFVVLEGFDRHYYYINDPANGRMKVSHDQFDMAFTGVALTFEQTADFVKGGQPPSLIQRLLPRLTGSWSGLIYNLVASFLLVLAGLVVPMFTLVFIDDILVQGLPVIHTLLVTMGLVTALIAVLTWLQQYHLLRLETKLTLTMSTRFFWYVFRLPVAFFTQRYAGDIVRRIDSNDRIANLLSGELATNLLGFAMIIFYAALMMFYDVTLTLITIMIAALNILMLRIAHQRRDDASRRLRIEQSAMAGTVMNGLQIIETIKATGGETDFFSKWAGQYAKTFNADQSYALYSKLLSLVPVLLTQLSIIAVLIIGSIRVIEGSLSIGMLAAFQAWVLAFLDPVNQLVNLGGRVQDAGADMSMLDDVLRYEPDPQVDHVVEDVGDVQTRLTGQLDLVNLSFGYSPHEPPLLDNVTLSLKPGHRVALVGASGSGKSTVARLIAGLYQPWEGQILFDGKRRDQIPRPVINRSLAMVDQDIFMFAGSIRENLSLWDHTIPLQDIVQAAKDAAIHNDISQRPGAYESLVAEGGRNFSGGQKQRLEIARALVKNPSILILDEATSALDPVTEKLIDDNLRRRGCSCVIVAHRLSTIRDCDEIIVFDQGRIVQRGTHDDLINQTGAYARLIKAEVTEESTNIMDTILGRLDF